jgi:signal transduction histidine kinase
MSIKIKLTIIILSLVAIPLLFVSVITFSNYKNSLTTSRLSQLQSMARFKAEEIEAYFEGLKNTLEMSRGFYNVRKNLPLLSLSYKDPHNREAAAIRKMLDPQLAGMQKALDLSDIMLADKSGAIVYVSNPEHYTLDLRRSLDEISPESLKQGIKGIYFSDIFINRVVGGRPEMFATAPISDLDGAPAGTIILEIDMAPLYRLIQDTVGLGITGEILVGKKSGGDIVYLNPLRHDTEVVLSRHVRIGDKIALPIQNGVAGKTGIGLSVDYRGNKVVAAWTHIPFPDWGLVAKIDASEEFAVVTNLLRLLLMVLAVVFVMAGVITFSVAQSISGPIQKLTKGAEIIGSGNLDYKVGMNLHDEVGRLSLTFDKMTHDLKETTASRDELNREIAVRKKAEQALHLTAQDLARSNKDLEQFAYVASHDLQEPLRAVGGFMGLLKNQYYDKLDAQAREYIDFSVDGAERMQGLIEGLLAFSRVGTRGGEFESFNLKEALDIALKNLNMLITESSAVVANDPLPVVTADRSQMTQLFQNLIANAVKFHGPQRPEIHIGAQHKERAWEIFVRDNGIGIDPQYFERIFLIFQRLHTRAQYKGTGIGLAVCKKIVERHGGKIWVESVPEEGSTFFFTIPDKGETA